MRNELRAIKTEKTNQDQLEKKLAEETAKIKLDHGFSSEACRIDKQQGVTFDFSPGATGNWS